MPKLFIGSVVWRQRDESYSLALEKLKARALLENWEIIDGTQVGDALVSRSRSIAGSQFLRSDADVFLSIDSDIVFDPKQVFPFCQKAMDLRGILGACYSGHSRTQFQPTFLLHEGQTLRFHYDAKPEEVRFVGGGFMAIDKSVFEKLSHTIPVCHKEMGYRSFWPFYQPMIIPSNYSSEHLYLSEDWAISEYARKVGVKTYLDPSIRLAHMSMVPVVIEDFFKAQIAPNQTYSLTLEELGKLTIRLETPQEEFAPCHQR